MDKKYIICLDIGGTKILGAIFDEKDKIIYRLKKKTKSAGDDEENVEKLIISVVGDMIKESGIKKSDIKAIAAGAPGVIDSAKGIVLFAPNLPWRDYDIASPISKEFGVPFYIGNDVNVGVYGEYRYGAAKGCDYVLGLFPGTGMGGGLIINGEMYTGRDFKGMEVGHMIVQPDGAVCGCGQSGCLEAYSSKKGMSAYILQQIRRGRECVLADKIENGVFKSKALKRALEAGDEVAIETVDRACHYMAIASGSLINIFSPDIIVYGGGVMEAVGDIFMEKIKAEVDRYCWPSIRSTVKLEKAALGDDSILYGALAMIKDAEKE